MKPGPLPIRASARPICQLCDYILQQPGYRRPFLATAALKAPAIRRQPGRHHGALAPISTRRLTTTTTRPRNQHPELATIPRTDKSLHAQLRRVEKHIEWIRSSSKVESEEAVLEALAALESIAKQSIEAHSRRRPAKFHVKQSSASALLSIGEDAAPEEAAVEPVTDSTPTPNHLSRLALDLLRDEKVFISPRVLEKYVDLQLLLHRPRAIPEIFQLYAHKPVPQLGSSPPRFSKAKPNASSQAIPPDVAEQAFRAALAAKDLPLALDIVDSTYRAPAWKRRKLITKGLPPTLLATLTPLGLYMIAQEFSLYSGYIDPWTFKMYSFAGLLTYFSCTGTLGFVALTTYNDHHDRVVWQPGTPLLDRWMREEERAAMDRIACEWGFKELWKRGDEEGPEWEGIRQLCLLRGMVLDKVDLMPGMNA